MDEKRKWKEARDEEINAEKCEKEVEDEIR
jgi:hypothetical protein